MSDIKLNGITYPASRKVAFPGADGKAVVFNLPEDADSELNNHSVNPVQNKVIHAAIQDVRQRQTSPYNFKGKVAAMANLPSSGNTVNDTYYVESAKYRVTWTGSAWQQSSMSESDYEDELATQRTALSELADIPSMSAVNLAVIEYEQGYLADGGIFTPTTGANSQKTTVAVPLDPGDYKVLFDGMNGTNPITYVRAIAVYNASDACTAYYPSTAGLTNFTVAASDAYVRINTQYTEVTRYEIIPDRPVAILDDVLVPTDATLTSETMAANSKATGDAVFAALHADQSVPYMLDLTTVDYEDGYLAQDGVFVASQDQQKTTVPLKLPPGRYTVRYRGLDDKSVERYIPRAVAVYDGDACVYYRLALDTDPETSFVVSKATETVRINTKYSVAYEYKLARERRAHNYVHARRPVITFVFDGDYNQNDDFANLFVSRNMRCGFAPQYDTAFPNNSLAQYKAWENDGFEILAHSSAPVGTQTDASDAEIAEIVRQSYNTIARYGFDLHGFVAYQGNTRAATVDAVKKYYDYGFTQLNHAGSQEETRPDLANPNLQFGVDGPYHMWRYSMQLSSLAQMKEAVDLAVTSNGLVVFYGHANSSALQNMTLKNIGDLLDYIYAKGVRVCTPYEAIRDYYSIRYGDFEFHA